MTVDAATAIATVGPSPLTRVRANAVGVPVVLADGSTWLLAEPGLAPALDAVRDRLFDAMTVFGRVDTVDVYEAAWLMLRANYVLTDDEAVALLAGAAIKALADATLDALFGREDGSRTYTKWARSALLSNGLRPESIAPTDLQAVLGQLVATGRAVPLDDYSEACEAARERGALVAIARGTRKADG